MMTRRWLAGAAFAAALLAPQIARAHEGHPHKVMGFVAARHEDRLQVTATDGKSADITLNDKTKVLRGRTVVSPDDIQPGERIVVTAVQTRDEDGRVTMVATEVKLGTSAREAKKEHVKK
jgi:hypothetical protein